MNTIRCITPTPRLLRRLAVGVALATVLTFATLFSAGESEASTFLPANPVYRMQINYYGACNPGTLQTTINSGLSITPTTPLRITLSGDIGGCVGTETASDYVRIDNELFKYSNVWATTATTQTNLTQAITPVQLPPFTAYVGTTTGVPATGQLRIGGELFRYSGVTANGFSVTARAVGGTVASTHAMNDIVDAGTEVQPSTTPPFNLYVNKCNDTGFPSSGTIYVNSESMTYSSKVCDGYGGNPDYFVVSSRASNKQHNVDSFVRAQNKLKLVSRAQPMYLSSGSAPPAGAPTQYTTPATHTSGVSTVRSPQTFLTCIGRIDTSGSSLTMRSRCYSMLAPGTAWPVPYTGQVMALTPQVYHNVSRGTIDGSGNVSTTTDIFGFTCFPSVAGRLWVRVQQDIAMDKNTTTDDDDIGNFRIYVYDNPQCANTAGNPVQTLTGANPGNPQNITLYQLDPLLDTDDDECSDRRELGSLAAGGGLRDPLNPWDFFDPDQNKANGLSDINYIANPAHIFKIYGQVGYTPDADRTINLLDADGIDDPTNEFDGPGPGAWNLQKGDNAIGLTDINLSAKSFAHTCA